MLQQPIGFNDSIRRSVETLGLGDNRKGPSSQVELTFSARKLANRDYTSKSDPVLIVYRGSTAKGGRQREVGRTEIIKDNLNPEWKERIKIDYFFESKQPLIFKIYDIDSISNSLQDQDFLGSVSCDLADIVVAPNSHSVWKLSGAHYVKGDLLIHAQEVDKGQRETLCFNVNLIEMKRQTRSFFSSPSLFLEFHRFLEDGSRFLAHRTPIRQHTSLPRWDNIQISLRHLCNCNKNESFLVECYNQQDNGDSPSLMGSVRATVSQLLQSKTVQLDLKKHKKMWGTTSVAHKDKPRGTLVFSASKIRIDNTFLDYISGGLQLEFATAVDFTASNGNQNSVQSLHYLGSNALNQYEMAIRSVLEICQHYNQQKVFDATGFGAKIPPHYECSHMFPLDVQTMNRRFQGIDGVLEAYKKAVSSIVLYGPTNFGPSISEFMFKAEKMSSTQYQILLIITDGAITDMKRTKELIIKASELPMSIIIIGVGQDSFDKMDKLDSDATLLECNGMRAKRDIVQFVPFRDFVPAHGRFASEDEYMETMRLLAKEVLAEVPEQVTSYMRMKGIKSTKSQVMHQNGQTNGYNPYMSGPGYTPFQNGGSAAPFLNDVPAAPYQNGGAAPYQNSGVAPYQNGGAVPYPNQGVAPYPNQGVASYQNGGAVPYPNQGGLPYPTQNGGSVPYPNQGGLPYPTQPIGSAPYSNQPTESAVPNQPTESTPYPLPSAPSLSSPEDQPDNQQSVQQQMGQLNISSN